MGANGEGRSLVWKGCPKVLTFVSCMVRRRRRWKGQDMATSHFALQGRVEPTRRNFVFFSKIYQKCVDSVFAKSLARKQIKNKMLAVCSLGWSFLQLIFVFLPRAFSVVMALSDHKYSFQKNNLNMFRVGRFEEFAAEKGDLLAELVPAARKNKVKFRKNMCQLVHILAAYWH